MGTSDWLSISGANEARSQLEAQFAARLLIHLPSRDDTTSDEVSENEVICPTQESIASIRLAQRNVAIPYLAGHLP